MGGREASIQEFPHQISIERNSRFSCGGSIVTARHVLTAAHCVPKNSLLIPNYQIRSGSSLRGEGGSLHRIAKAYVHEKYYINKYNNSGFDVAVLVLKDPIEFDENRQPIKLFEDGQPTKPNSIATVSGWGRLRHQGPLPKKLQCVNVITITKEECREAYKNFGGLEQGEICIDYEGEEVRSSCNGDSGGPLVIDGKLAGIVAHGEECGNSTYPSVFTEVAHFRKWIDHHIKL